MTRTIILNNQPPPTAVYRIAADDARLLGSSSDLINLVSHSALFNREFAGRTFYGVPLRFWLLESMINVGLQDRVFRTAFDAVRETSKAEQSLVVHCASQGLRPPSIDLPLAVTIHDNPSVSLETDMYGLNRLQRRVVRFNLRRYARVAQAVTLTRYVKSGLEDWGYDGNITVVPPAPSPAFRPLPDRDKIRASLGIPDSRHVVLSVSTATKRKNLGTVRKVMQILGPSFHLVRVGPAIDSCQAFENVSDDRLNAIYNASDVLFFPSLEEGCGLPVLEALASGLPVVASNIDSIEEIADKAAFLIPPMETGAYVASIKEALSARDEIVAKGLTQVSKFSHELRRARLNEFHSRVLSSSIS